jgi:hypothetical protein
VRDNDVHVLPNKFQRQKWKAFRLSIRVAEFDLARVEADKLVASAPNAPESLALSGSLSASAVRTPIRWIGLGYCARRGHTPLPLPSSVMIATFHRSITSSARGNDGVTSGQAPWLS